MINWALVEADLHQFYGIDLRGPDDLRAMPWRALKVRIAGLASIDSRLTGKLAPAPKLPSMPNRR
jgi:hypothetical protein